MTLSIKEAIMTSENAPELSEKKCISFNAYGLCGRVANTELTDAEPCADCRPLRNWQRQSRAMRASRCGKDRCSTSDTNAHSLAHIQK